MKTSEELNALKEEVETLSRKLLELNEEELTQVIGGKADNSCPKNLKMMDTQYCVDFGSNYVCPYAHKVPSGGYVCEIVSGFIFPDFFLP